MNSEVEAPRRARFLQYSVRWFIFMVGLMVMAFGVTLMIEAEMGSAPWDVLHIGLFLQFGLTIGTWSILVGLFIVALTAILTKSWPPAGAIVNMLLVGVFIDVFMLIPWLDTPASWLGQLMMFLLGLFIGGFGIGLYIAPKCGAGPRDSLMLALTQLTGWKVQWVRASMEVIVLLCGWLLGGPVFIGTLIFTFGIGHIVGFTLPQCQKFVDKITNLKHFGGVQVENINKGTIRVNHHDGISQ